MKTEAAIFILFVFALSLVSAQTKAPTQCSQYRSCADCNASPFGCRFVWGPQSLTNSSLNGTCMNETFFQTQHKLGRIDYFALYESEVNTTAGQRMLRDKYSLYPPATAVLCYDRQTCFCNKTYVPPNIGFVIITVRDSITGNIIGTSTVYFWITVSQVDPTTGSVGYSDVPANRYTSGAEAFGYLPGNSSQFQVTRNSTTYVTIFLEPKPNRVNVLVVDKSNAPLTGVSLVLFRSAVSYNTSASTDATGRFSYYPLPNGTYTATGCKTGYACGNSNSTTVLRDDIGNLFIRLGDLPGNVTVYVWDAVDGTFIVNASVNYTVGSFRYTTTPGALVYTLEGEKSYTFTASSDFYLAASNTTFVRLGGSHRVDIYLRPIIVSIRLRDFLSEGYPNFTADWVVGSKAVDAGTDENAINVAELQAIATFTNNRVVDMIVSGNPFTIRLRSLGLNEFRVNATGYNPNQRVAFIMNETMIGQLLTFNITPVSFTLVLDIGEVLYGFQRASIFTDFVVNWFAYKDGSKIFNVNNRILPVEQDNRTISPPTIELRDVGGQSFGNIAFKYDGAYPAGVSGNIRFWGVSNPVQNPPRRQSQFRLLPPVSAGPYGFFAPQATQANPNPAFPRVFLRGRDFANLSALVDTITLPLTHTTPVRYQPWEVQFFLADVRLLINVTFESAPVQGTLFSDFTFSVTLEQGTSFNCRQSSVTESIQICHPWRISTDLIPQSAFISFTGPLLNRIELSNYPGIVYSDNDAITLNRADVRTQYGLTIYQDAVGRKGKTAGIPVLVRDALNIPGFASLDPTGTFGRVPDNTLPGSDTFIFKATLSSV